MGFYMYMYVSASLHVTSQGTQRGRGGGGNKGSYFIPNKIPTSEFVYPKAPLHFWHTPKNPTPAVNCA